MDTSQWGVVGPVFKNDGNLFEYIPIDEGENLHVKTKHKVKSYDEITARTKYGEYISEYLPDKLEKYYIHLDPCFKGYAGAKHYTYGEPKYKEYENGDNANNTKASALWDLDIGDYLFFHASLAPFSYKVYNKNKLYANYLIRHQKGRMNKYLIGYFKVKGIAEVRKYLGFEIEKDDVLKKKGNVSIKEIKQNAHSRRSNDHFIIVIGDPNESELLKYAILLTKKSIIKNTVTTFILNNKARRLMGKNKKTDTLRNIRNLDTDAVLELLDEI